MRIRKLVAALALGATIAPLATAGNHRPDSKLFHHIATFDVTENAGSEVAEIVDATRNGKTLVYTDSEQGLIGFVDISDPSSPQPDGSVPVGGEPTSVAMHRRYALVGVNTSTTHEVTCVEPGDDGVLGTADDESEDIEFITGWNGELAIIDTQSRVLVHKIPLGGQPDSVAVSPNGRYAAIAIENERNEDVDGGILPQGRETIDSDPCALQATGPSEPGRLMIVDLQGKPTRWSTRSVALTGISDVAPDDPEPEFVDINRANQAVVTLQENNHIVIVNLRNGKIINDFPAGSVYLMNVDTVEEDLIHLDTEIEKRREPDAVAWINNGLLATANEGDYEDEFGDEGGSRGFTIFHKRGDGNPTFESYEAFEHLLVSAGHYNEGRSENKGVEPEAVETGRYGNQTLLFVGSERSNAVGVFQTRGRRAPRLLQVLPTGMGPEGLKAIPRRGLFVASTEAEAFGDGIPTMINIYQRKNGPAAYPMIASADDVDGLPIPWVALSGLAGDPWDADILYAVSDSFLAKGFVYTVDVSAKPALIIDRLEVLSDGLDLEGVAVGPDGSFWLGSEGQSPGGRENRVLKVDPDTGDVLLDIALPADLIDERRSNGIEGIAVTGSAGAEVVYVAIQRAWPDEGDTDESNTKIGRYDVAGGEWSFVHYPLQPEGSGGWIGLSELTHLPDGSFAVIERDKGWGPSTPPNAELKAVYQIDLAGAPFAPYDQTSANGGLVTIDKTLLADLTPLIAKHSIWTAEKLEGLAVAADNQVYAVTDNDGVDDAPGETVFLHLGDLERLGEVD